MARFAFHWRRVLPATYLIGLAFLAMAAPSRAQDQADIADPQVSPPRELILSDAAIDRRSCKRPVVVDDVPYTWDALEKNVEIEFKRNNARYSFLRWGQKAFTDFKVVPPRTVPLVL